MSDPFILWVKFDKPVEFNNPTYTYLNLIVDRAFTDPNTEKNYIAFGVTVTLNYLDPSKDINLVQNEVVERIIHFLK
ncbi:7212_t:CDS:2 [Entrophospora sp. SA101]|nr:8575_t:CDS:2 [Entrophospora sp. SA101]CAJ0908544.1 7212_t:CDS:2 [Entrophospora sp. SA101]